MTRPAASLMTTRLDPAAVPALLDGGGKRSAAQKPIIGFDRVLRACETLAKMFKERRSQLLRVAFINGLPGFISREADGEIQTTALDIQNDRVEAIYVVRNPDKLRHLH